MAHNAVLDILLEPLYSTQHVNLGEFPTSPVQQIKARARRESVAKPPTPLVFCELLELSRAHEELYFWKEKARWIKYEETVEKSGKRWSKPHIPLVNAVSLFQLRNCIKRGAVLLDIAVDSYVELIDAIVRAWEQRRDIGMEQIGRLTGVMMRNKQHLTKTTIKHNLAHFLIRQSTSSINKASIPKTLSERNLPVRAMPSAPEDEEADYDEEQIARTEQLKKYLENAEGAIMLIGRTQYIDKPCAAFVRLKVARVYPTLSEAPVPTRFVFVLLVPTSHSAEELEGIGRCLGALLTDVEYQPVAYYATDVADLTYGIDCFMRDMTMIPPGKWPPDMFLEPNDSLEEAFQRQESPAATYQASKMMLNLDGLQYTGKLFGGLVADVRRRLPFYISDFTDPFKSCRAFTQVIAGTTFLFFAQLTNLIAFGSMMGTLLYSEKEQTGPAMAVIECLVACVISGVIFALFSGQPLCILGATGPVLLFEALFFEFCNERGWDFLMARWWLMFWGAIILLLLVAFDASFLVAYITRFTEETFAMLIAMVFIVESFEAILELGTKAPFTRNPKRVLKDPCICNASLSGNGSWALYKNMTGDECLEVQGSHVSGLQCVFKPDVFAFSLLLFLGSFLLAMWLTSFRDSQFFTRKIRTIVSDFSLLISLLIVTFANYLIGIPVPTLKVPHQIKPTDPRRSWIINPVGMPSDQWWIPLAMIPPSLLLVMLVVMDQQITTVILNRKENMLRKGFGYHLDLLIIVFLMLLSGALGIPLMLSATILSLTHMRSLRMESEVVAPGEKPIYLGVNEQRVSHLVAHILIAFSIYLSPIEDLIPRPGLLGIFLYMGVSCLVDLQLFHRILLFFTPSKHQPSFNYLRLIPLKRVHWFTLIQLFALGLLLAVNYIDQIEMLFPIMLVILVGWRRLLNWLFTPRELCVLDDPLPPWRALKKEGGISEVEVEGGVDQELLRAYGKTNTESYVS